MLDHIQVLLVVDTSLSSYCICSFFLQGAVYGGSEKKAVGLER